MKSILEYNHKSIVILNCHTELAEVSIRVTF